VSDEWNLKFATCACSNQRSARLSVCSRLSVKKWFSCRLAPWLSDTRADQLHRPISASWRCAVTVYAAAVVVAAAARWLLSSVHRQRITSNAPVINKPYSKMYYLQMTFIFGPSNTYKLNYSVKVVTMCLESG